MSDDTVDADLRQAIDDRIKARRQATRDRLDRDRADRAAKNLRRLHGLRQRHNRKLHRTKEDTMAGDTTITIVGNLVEDPNLRFTPSGVAVANFRIASTPRFFDRQTNEWKDGDALFLTCNVWKQPAENCADSLTKGMRVIVQGRLKQRSYETKQGEKRTVYEIEVDEIGPSLRSATAKVAKAQRNQQPQQNGFGGAPQNQPPADQWSNQAPAGAGFGGNDSQPPF